MARQSIRPSRVETDTTMQTQPHLYRRGSVYQWRRRVQRQSTVIVDFKLSLQTTDRRRAGMLARKISAESDAVMDQIIRNRITPEEGRKWLARVIEAESRKIEQLVMLEKVDSLSPEDDHRHNVAMRDAWAHIERAGLNGSTETLSDDLVASNVTMLRSDLAGQARRAAVRQDFAEVSGRQESSALGMLELIRLLISGKHEAWRSQFPVATEPATAESATPLVQSIQDAIEVPAPSAPTPVSASAEDPSIMAVVARMVTVKRIEGIEEKTLRQYESFAGLFTLLTGVEDVRLITQTTAMQFRSKLYMIPKSWGKSPGDRTASLEDILARAATLPPEKVGLSVGTINRHLEHLSQVVAWAADENIAVDSRLRPEKLRRKDTVRARDKKDAFTPEQLALIFRNPVWTGSESERFQTRPGDTIFWNGVFWCPLIASVTGARREEIAGLSASDVKQLSGVHCLSIEDSEIRRVKNLSSRRIVPIHSGLIKMGFLDYVAANRASASQDLFPDLREPKSGAHGRKLGRRMRQIIDLELGGEGLPLSFHSFRHYVQNALDDLGVEDAVVRDIVGHEGKDVHDKVYRKTAALSKLQDAIERLELPLPTGGVGKLGGSLRDA